MDVFVWTKMGVESGEGLEQIVRRKEAERVEGNGDFWWGMGNSLGPAVRDAARAQGGKLPVLFSVMLGKPRAPDSAPEMIWLWTGWEDEAGRIHAIPPHAKVISRGAAAKDRHYALVCHSDAPLALARGGERFDPARCRTLSGKVPGASLATSQRSAGTKIPADRPSLACHLATGQHLAAGQPLVR
jgi:hypothetical protein